MRASSNVPLLARVLSLSLLSLIVIALPHDGATPPPDQLSTIIEQLKSPDLAVQGEALEKLKGLKEKAPALPALHALLAAHNDDASPDAREKREINLMGVVQNVISIGDPSSLPPLKEVLARENNDVSKVFLAWGTASLGDDSGREAVLARLKDTGSPNRVATASALRTPAMMACKDLIDRNRLDPNVLVEIARQSSKDWDAAGAWAKNLNIDAVSNAELPALLERVEDTKRLSEAIQKVWMAAFAVLAGTKSGLPVLIKALHDEDPHLADLRGSMAVTLGWSHDARATPPLIELLGSEKSDKVREAVAGALKDNTGQNFGQDAAAWSAWWKSEEAKKQPKTVQSSKTAPPKAQPKPKKKG